MDKEILNFGDIEIERNTFYQDNPHGKITSRGRP